MNAIILVAGRGSRLRPRTDTVPKCLTEVCGTPILMNALRVLEGCGISSTALVVGYLAEEIRAAVGTAFGRMPITYVANSVFAATSTSVSLLLGIQATLLATPLLVLEGDVFFEERLLADFLHHPAANATIVEAYHPPLDGSFVSLGADGMVQDWIHMTHRSEQFTLAGKFKTVNIHRFEDSFVRTVLAPTLERYVEKSLGVAPLEYVMRDIVMNSAGRIHAFQTGGRKWFEIDDERDLEYAEALFAATYA